MGRLCVTKLNNMFGGALFPILMLLLTSPGAQADALEADPAGESRQTEIQLFEVMPVKRAGAILAPNALTPAAPAPLSVDEINRMLGALSEPGVAGLDPENPNVDRIKLSAKTPYLEGRGVLTTHQAMTVHPETSVHFDNDPSGSVGVKLFVEKDKHYLLDFYVRSQGIGSYRVETESGKQLFEDESGRLTHLLLGLSAKSTGWTTVRLNREGAAYYLYFVEISKLN